MTDPQRQKQTPSPLESPLDSLDYADIRRHVEATLQQRKHATRITFLVINLIFYIVSMAIMWGATFATPELSQLVLNSPHSPASTLLMLPTVFWGMAIFFQFISLTIDSRRGEQQLRDQVTMREVSKAIMRQTSDQLADLDIPIEKPKRRVVAHSAADIAQQVRLSDDGELVPVGLAESSDQLSASAQQKATDQSR